jgi:acetate kinase
MILSLNAGSSSLKFALFDPSQNLERIVSGSIDRIGLAHPSLTLKDTKDGKSQIRPVSAPDHASCVELLLNSLGEHAGGSEIAALGHRVVHGGTKFTEPQQVTAEVSRELHSLIPFAPDHLPAALGLITAFGERYANIPQIVCFDTGFHRDLPRVARLLPIPRRYEAAGVRRYGFHGLSCEFLVQELSRLDPAAAQSRVILAHLGNGASLTAVRKAKSIDTSMAFTPAAGLMMGRRSGDIDAGLVGYLAETEGMSAPQFHHLATQESGLLGVSEISSDMRELLVVEGTDKRAAEAINLFCYQVKKWIGAFAAVLGGVDTLVFSGGIGENLPMIRARICDGLHFLGVELNASANAQNAPLVSMNAGKVAVRIIRTDEEIVIARSVCRVLGIDSAKEG